MNDDIRELCYDKLKDLTRRELIDILRDTVLFNLDRNELREMIEKYFVDSDWEWFLEEYVKVD